MIRLINTPVLYHLQKKKEEVIQQENMYLDYGIKCILIYIVLEKPYLAILEQNFISFYIREQAE